MIEKVKTYVGYVDHDLMRLNYSYIHMYIHIRMYKHVHYFLKGITIYYLWISSSY